MRPGSKAAPVAVVGGGIAGAAAVLTLTQRGVTPIWIAPGASTPDPPTDRVGEALAPAANPILAALGVSDLVQSARISRRSNAMISAWGSQALVERNAISQPDGAGWVLDRAAFDRALAARAALAVTPHAAGLADHRRDAGGWRLALSDGAECFAAQVLDATGRNAAFARRQAVRRRTDQQVAVYAFLEHADEGVEPTRATLIESVADGWWYAALLPGARLSLTWFTDPDLVDKALTRDLAAWRARIAQTRHVSRWIEDAGFQVSRPPALASAGSTWMEPCAGEGWAAVGDAAAAFDPLSSHGMTTALWSGRAAALAVADERAGAAGRLAGYADDVKAGVERFLEQRARFYGTERRHGDRPYWMRRHARA